MISKISLWQKIALVSASMASAAWGGTAVYQLHTNGSIWQYTGVPCSGTVCSGWLELDSNPETAMIAASGGKLYQLHWDGSIWSYTSSGWIELDNNPNAGAIGVGGSILYELHADDSIWQYTGTPCHAGACPGWVKLDQNPRAVEFGFGANAQFLYDCIPTARSGSTRARRAVEVPAQAGYRSTTI